MSVTRTALMCLGISASSLLAPPSALSQPVTIGGSLKDQYSSTPLGGATIEIVNATNPAERYVTLTDTLGEWTSTFEPAAIEDPGDLPRTFALSQNYPNPFNPSTIIPFHVGRVGIVRLSVYTVLGQLLDVREVDLVAGDYQIEWSARGAAGMLFYSLEVGGERITRKMVQLNGGQGAGLGEVVSRSPSRVLERTHRADASEYWVVASRFDYLRDSTLIAAVNNARTDMLLTSVHRAALVFDLHNDVLEMVINGYTLGDRHTYNHSDLPRFKEGGMDAQMLALWADPSAYGTRSYQRVLDLIAAFERERIANADSMVLARSPQEIEAAVAQGKFAAVFGVEGGHAIEESLAKLDTLHRYGALYLTITWNNSTSWAVSSADSRSATVGLSDFGRQVIRAMDSLGMVIDVSHTGIQTINDILSVTKNPIVASHSGVRALMNRSRNLTDDQIRAIAAGGGVIGVVFYTWFLSPWGYADVDTVIRHIDYIRDLVGIDHVAIGSDYDGMDPPPVGLEDVSKLPALTSALLSKGYSVEDVRKILGGNYMRVLRAVCK